MRKQLGRVMMYRSFVKVVSVTKANVEATLQTAILGEQIYIARCPLTTLQQSMRKDICIITSLGQKT